MSTTSRADTPAGVEYWPSRNRNRSRAQRTEAKRRNEFVGSSIADFNAQENRGFASRPKSPTPARAASSATQQVPGWRLWWIISAHYVELSKHTEDMGTATYETMVKMGYNPAGEAQ